METSFTFRPVLLVRVFITLLLLNILTTAIEFLHHDYFNEYIPSYFDGRIELLDFDGEHNVPTYFSVANLLISALLLFTISKRVKDSTQPLHYKKWFLIGWVFVWLAMDELFSLHEKLIGPTQILLRDFLKSDDLGPLHFAWFIPYTLLFLLIGLYFLRFVSSLPRQTLLSFIVSGLIFISGAVGMEIISGYYVSIGGSKASLIYRLSTTIEEALEMLGVIYFIHSLINYMKFRYIGNISFKFQIEKERKVQNSPTLLEDRVLH